MLPLLLPKLHFPKSSLTRIVSTTRQFKTTRLLRPLAVSPSAAIKKPKKTIASKKSPIKEPKKRFWVEHMVELEIYCRVLLKPRPQPPNSRPSQKPRLVSRSARKQDEPPHALRLLKKLKSAIKAKIEKVNKLFKKRQEKRKVSQRIRRTSPIRSRDSKALSIEAVLFSETSQKSPSTNKPRSCTSKNNRLRGGDSKFAVANFDPSKIEPFTIDDPEMYRASMEAHLEIRKEIALVSGLEAYDALTAAESRVNEGRSALEYADVMEIDSDDIEMKDAFIDIQVSSITTSNTNTPVASQPQPEPLPRSQPPMQDDNMLDVALATTPLLANTIVPALAPALRLGFLPKRSSGLRHVSFADSVKDTPPAPASPTRSMVLNNFKTSSHAPTSSPDSSQRGSTTTNQKTQPSNTVATGRALRPPPGARRALPMNLIKRD